MILPLKNDSGQIPPPLVEEVQNYLREMLESGAIRPSQSTWCNAEVLVWKKDGDLADKDGRGIKAVHHLHSR